MHKGGSPDLGHFALQLSPQAWIVERNFQKSDEIVWSRETACLVSIWARRDGFLIFDFSKNCELSGGNIPAHNTPPGERIPQEVIDATQERENIAYLRFSYMNSFLLALFSAYSTIDKTAHTIQEPVDPTNYFGAQLCGEKAEIYCDSD